MLLYFAKTGIRGLAKVSAGGHNGMSAALRRRTSRQHQALRYARSNEAVSIDRFLQRKRLHASKNQLSTTFIEIRQSTGTSLDTGHVFVSFQL